MNFRFTICSILIQISDTKKDTSVLQKWRFLGCKNRERETEVMKKYSGVVWKTMIRNSCFQEKLDKISEGECSYLNQDGFAILYQHYLFYLFGCSDKVPYCSFYPAPLFNANSEPSKECIDVVDTRTRNNLLGCIKLKYMARQVLRPILECNVTTKEFGMFSGLKLNTKNYEVLKYSKNKKRHILIKKADPEVQIEHVNEYKQDKKDHLMHKMNARLKEKEQNISSYITDATTETENRPNRSIIKKKGSNTTNTSSMPVVNMARKIAARNRCFANELCNPLRQDQCLTSVTTNLLVNANKSHAERQKYITGSAKTIEGWDDSLKTTTAFSGQVYGSRASLNLSQAKQNVLTNNDQFCVDTNCLSYANVLCILLLWFVSIVFLLRITRRKI